MRTAGKALCIVAALIALGAAATGGDAGAPKSLKVFVNGVDVTGLAGQTFKGCSVTFDDDGNVRIDAPGYEVSKPEIKAAGGGGGTAGQPAKAPTKKKYFLVTSESQGAKVWDSYSVIVNGNAVKKFTSADGVILHEITKEMTAGKNQVLVTATKQEGYPGGTSQSWYRILIGAGHEEEKKIVIDKTLVQWTRKANDADPGSKSVVIDAQ